MKASRAIVLFLIVFVVAIIAARGSKVIPEARITVYWQDSDPATGELRSSSGVRLQPGHVAVDPRVIPYGTRLRIEGWGEYVAVDTGSAVVKRRAALRQGRNCPVVDVFFSRRADALKAVETRPAFAKVEILPGQETRRGMGRVE